MNVVRPAPRSVDSSLNVAEISGSSLAKSPRKRHVPTLGELLQPCLFLFVDPKSDELIGLLTRGIAVYTYLIDVYTSRSFRSRTYDSGLGAARMKVTMLLADAAQAANGKLYILGSGWSCAARPNSNGHRRKAQGFRADQANTKHTWRLSLVDSDGATVTVESPTGAQSLEFRGRVRGRTTRGNQTRHTGSTCPSPFPLPLYLSTPEPDMNGDYELDGELVGDSRLAFSVRAAPN